MSQTFILQHHKARRAGPHQDLYLEAGLSFVAYAIPKGIPTVGRTKHLAIKVADHTPSQVMFEGEITEGYGKGTKQIIDEGTYKYLTQDIIEFIGSTFHGKYYLKHWEGNKYLIWRV